MQRRFATLRKPFKVLAIETSCDDTAVSIVESSGKIFSESVVHQHKIHAEYRGIVPHLASQAHRNILPSLLRNNLEQSNLNISQIDAIAATRGPGLSGCLSIGYDAGKTLAAVCKVPFYSINHMVRL
jgi:N6-L-threonylcarbamoyladenine synthase